MINVKHTSWLAIGTPQTDLYPGLWGQFGKLLLLIRSSMFTFPNLSIHTRQTDYVNISLFYAKNENSNFALHCLPFLYIVALYCSVIHCNVKAVGF